MLAVVLALLVLLCAGVISFLLKQGGNSSSLGRIGLSLDGAAPAFVGPSELLVDYDRIL